MSAGPAEPSTTRAETASAAEGELPKETRDIDSIQSDIERTREELGETVDALAAKLDVKARTRARVTRGKERAVGRIDAARDHAAQLAAHARDGMNDEEGSPRREAIIAASALAATVAALVVLVSVRRRRR